MTRVARLRIVRVAPVRTLAFARRLERAQAAVMTATALAMNAIHAVNAPEVPSGGAASNQPIAQAEAATSPIVNATRVTQAMLATASPRIARPRCAATERVASVERGKPVRRTQIASVCTAQEAAALPATLVTVA